MREKMIFHIPQATSDIINNFSGEMSSEIIKWKTELVFTTERLFLFRYYSGLSKTDLYNELIKKHKKKGIDLKIRFLDIGRDTTFNHWEYYAKGVFYYDKMINFQLMDFQAKRGKVDDLISFHYPKKNFWFLKNRWVNVWFHSDLTHEVKAAIRPYILRYHPNFYRKKHWSMWWTN